jgi:hypothetical protein
MKKASQKTQRNQVALSLPLFQTWIIVSSGTRNLLREGGFERGPVELDELWVGLVERAVRKKSGS